jgi:hypothetical protein
MPCRANASAVMHPTGPAPATNTGRSVNILILDRRVRFNLRQAGFGGKGFSCIAGNRVSAAQHLSRDLLNAWTVARQKLFA